MIHKKTELLSECLQDKQQQLLGNDNAEKEKIPIYHKPLNHSLGNYRKRQDITNKIVNNSNVTNPQAHKIIAKNLPKQEL